MTINKILLIPILVGAVAQVSKILVEAIRTGNINLRLLNTYGGMPSSHTALVISMVTVVGLEVGLASPIFLIALIFAAVTIRDAIGLRMYLSEHAKILNRLIREVPSQDKPSFPQRVIERIGHSPLEALMGGLVGLTATLIFWQVFP